MLQSEQSARHVFIPQSQVVDDSIEAMIKDVYDDEQIKSDISLGEEFSQDNLKFMKIMDNCKKVENMLFPYLFVTKILLYQTIKG